MQWTYRIYFQEGRPWPLETVFCGYEAESLARIRTKRWTITAVGWGRMLAEVIPGIGQKYIATVQRLQLGQLKMNVGV